MQLECYKIYDIAPEIVPGRSTRDWMDAFPDRQPYRCLPLSMANSTGWEILCPMDIKIQWNGGPGKKRYHAQNTRRPPRHCVLCGQPLSTRNRHVPHGSLIPDTAGLGIDDHGRPEFLQRRHRAADGIG